VRYHGQFAYITGELTDGESLPLLRLRYGGSAHRWGTALHLAGKDRYEDQRWFTGTAEDALDLARGPYLTDP
jgi:hypothetical protein